MNNFKHVDNLIRRIENVIQTPITVSKGSKISVGVDLGTMFTVIVVCDEQGEPLCCCLRQTEVVRDGLVVDYTKARQIVSELKKEVEELIGVELTKAAIAVPPGTLSSDIQTHRYVVEGAGMEVVVVEDEPTAANRVLKIQNGAVVDIGGGTTGISIFKDAQVIYTADEATGGTHFTYVIAGNYKIPIDEAEKLKVNLDKQDEILPLVVPVVHKIASIIKTHISNYSVDNITLCGGTSCLKNIEKIIEKEIDIKTNKPFNPFLVTPIGIALSCPPYLV